MNKSALVKTLLIIILMMILGFAFLIYHYKDFKISNWLIMPFLGFVSLKGVMQS
jgi:tryptophan-rich sensory protein